MNNHRAECDGPHGTKRRCPGRPRPDPKAGVASALAHLDRARGDIFFAISDRVCGFGWITFGGGEEGWTEARREGRHLSGLGGPGVRGWLGRRWCGGLLGVGVGMDGGGGGDGFSTGGGEGLVVLVL